MHLEPKEQAVYDLVVTKGPLTPIDVSKAIGVTSMVASAILSTLVDRGFIKTSKMKYGTSKLFYSSGQEAKVRDILRTVLSPLKLKAVDTIKKERILLDENISPQLRLFFSEVPDFVKKLEVVINGNNVVVWAYWNVTEAEIKSFFDSRMREMEKEEQITSQEKSRPLEQDTHLEKEQSSHEEPKEQPKQVEQTPVATEIKPKKKVRKVKRVVEPSGYVKDVLEKLDLDIVKKKIKKHEAELIINLDNPLSSEEAIVWIKPNATQDDVVKAYVKSLDKKKRVYLITNNDLKNKFGEFVKIIKI